MTNEYGRSIDKTFLSIDKAEERGFIHRDYIAHCLRWSHVIKYLQEKQRYKTARVLDIGCGREAPLIKTLYTARLLPYYYIGVDVGKIEPNVRFPDGSNVVFLPNTNVLDLEPRTTDNEAATMEVITMFECLEHVEEEMGVKILKHVSTFMDEDSVFFMSTPNFNGKAAKNHVHEWTYEALAEALVKQGFVIERCWGTFASISDYVQHLNRYTGLPAIFDLLREYYDVNYLSTIFAPLFAEHSRNILWKCTYPGKEL